MSSSAAEGTPSPEIESQAIKPLTELKSWAALTSHAETMRKVHLRTLFADDAARGEKFTTEAAGLFLDYSKNRITDETLGLLLELANESGLAGRIAAMFRGDKINITEKRAVLHTALRPACTQYWTRWPRSPTRCAAASGGGTPASAYATWSTLASAALTWGR